jgi:PTH1 family peptidyl-tRNA hydrolase
VPAPPAASRRPERTARSGLRRLFRPFWRRAEAPVAVPDALVLGLGNPGPDYEDTRHNVGFAVVDRLAARAGGVAWAEAAHALVAEATVDGQRLVLAKPMTFMNRSGQTYVALLKRYRLAPEAALVVYDDLALPLGALRLRERGGAGGHNGVQSVIASANSKDFPRLRVGIGDSFPPGGQVQYVLDPFTDAQRPAVEEAVEAAADAALTFAHEGLPAAMNQFNRRG